MHIYKRYFENSEAWTNFWIPHVYKPNNVPYQYPCVCISVEMRTKDIRELRFIYLDDFTAQSSIHFSQGPGNDLLTTKDISQALDELVVECGRKTELEKENARLREENANLRRGTEIVVEAINEARKSLRKNQTLLGG